jgi:hypothetical protein
MNKNNTTNEAKESDPIKYYTDVLMNHIINFDSSEEYERMYKYISALSFYIFKSNGAYKYNLPYLNAENKNFVDFLRHSKNKYDILSRCLKAVLKEPDIISADNDEKKNVKILLDEFFEANLSNEIQICDNPSINSIKRKQEDSVVTVIYTHNRSKKLRTIKNCNEQLLIDAVKKILKDKK